MLKVIEFNRNTKPSAIFAACENYDFIFLIGHDGEDFQFHCTEDMTPDEIIGFLERMKIEAMKRF